MRELIIQKNREQITSLLKLQAAVDRIDCSSNSNNTSIRDNLISPSNRSVAYASIWTKSIEPIPDAVNGRGSIVRQNRQSLLNQTRRTSIASEREATALPPPPPGFSPDGNDFLLNGVLASGPRFTSRISKLDERSSPSSSNETDLAFSGRTSPAKLPLSQIPTAEPPVIRVPKTRRYVLLSFSYVQISMSMEAQNMFENTQ